MSVLRYPHPVLSLPTKPVVWKEKTVETLEKLKAELKFQCYAANGAAVAANQIGVPVRVFYEKETDCLYVNPEIMVRAGKRISEEEGCLSFPGLRVEIRRWDNITLQWQDMHGEKLTGTFTDFRARVVQHELEHLDGKTFLDRFDFRTRQSLMSKVR